MSKLLCIEGRQLVELLDLLIVNLASWLECSLLHLASKVPKLVKAHGRDKLQPHEGFLKNTPI